MTKLNHDVHLDMIKQIQSGFLFALVCAIAFFTEGKSMGEENKRVETATFGGGCFWCVEAVYQLVPGVLTIKPGYAGGHVKQPTYQQVSRGNTGHAEVIQLTYDPDVVTYDTLLDLFWKAHDPTQLNRQGADIGTQYRSVIFYHNEAQKKAAEASRDREQASGEHRGDIVTEISEAPEFYVAEDYHHNYYRSNPNAGYSRAVIAPKLDKIKPALKQE